MPAHRHRRHPEELAPSAPPRITDSFENPSPPDHKIGRTRVGSRRPHPLTTKPLLLSGSPLRRLRALRVRPPTTISLAISASIPASIRNPRRTEEFWRRAARRVRIRAQRLRQAYSPAPVCPSAPRRTRLVHAAARHALLIRHHYLPAYCFQDTRLRHRRRSSRPGSAQMTNSSSRNPAEHLPIDPPSKSPGEAGRTSRSAFLRRQSS